jgi:hypothetical protein
VDYATKGVTVNADDDTIYVLSRSHDTIYVYTKELQLQRQIKFDNDHEDCNFLVYDSRQQRIFIGCENQVHMINARTGKSIHQLTPKLDGVQVSG